MEFTLPKGFLRFWTIILLLTGNKYGEMWGISLYYDFQNITFS